MEQEESTKLDSGTERRLPPNAGKGRPKGSQNKFTKQVKEMILEALDEAGGVDYLAKQASENPAAFMTLVGKVLPLTLAGDPDAPIAIQRIELVAHSDDSPSSFTP